MTDNTNADCTFCKIVAGELPCTNEGETDEFLAFRDINPAARVHVLVVPKKHHENLDRWVESGESSDRMLAFVRETAEWLGVGGGYKLQTSVGEAGGQDVFHLHWHIIAP